jgi:membrane-associated phospholipid phosphatase
MRQLSAGGTDLRHRHRAGASIWWVSALLAGFAGLGVVAHGAKHGTALDHDVLRWMVDQRQAWLTTIAIAITNAGSPVAMGLLAVIVAAVLWWRRRSIIPGLVVVSTLAAAAGLSTLTKGVVGAQRPSRSTQLVLEIDPSFPSGHVTGTLALTGIVAVVLGRGQSVRTCVALVAGVIVLTSAVALTRLYLGVHWLTDIGGGILLGAAAVLVGALVLRKATIARTGIGEDRNESPATLASRVA